MKKLNLLFAVAAFITTTTVFSQTTKDKWLIGVGAHAVDYTSVRGAFDGFFDYDDYSLVPPLSKITVARSLNNSFAVDLEASFGEVDNIRIGIDDEFYILAGLGLRYKFANNYILKEGSWFDPYLRIGANYHRYDYTKASFPYFTGDATIDEGDFAGLEQDVEPQEDNFVVNGGAGINFWVTNNFGINVESNYNWLPAFEQDYFNHFQHSVSAVFKFGNNDKDGDGVINSEDKCIDVPGPADNDGCPYQDTDGDGILDNVDNCVDVAGPAENDGCPWEDSDGDGALDKDDACPNEAGPAANNYCPYKDTDGDGLLDKDDDCPSVPCPNGQEGCVKGCVKKIDDVVGDINVGFKVNFDTNKSSIRSDSQTTLNNKANQIKAALKLFPNLKLYVDGHTDSSGSAAYNKKLSTSRAASVARELESKGVPAGVLESRGYGEEVLKCMPESTKADKECNRRVEVTLKSK